MKNNWNKILNELSYRVSSGIPDLTNEQHLIKLWDILKEHNWNIDARVELIKNLQEKVGKVYVQKGKGPSGVKLQVGPRGGKYYMGNPKTGEPAPQAKVDEPEVSTKQTNTAKAYLSKLDIEIPKDMTDKQIVSATKSEFERRKFLSDTVDLMIEELKQTKTGAGAREMTKEQWGQLKDFAEGNGPKIPQYEVTEQDIDDAIDLIKASGKKKVMSFLQTKGAADPDSIRKGTKENPGPGWNRDRKMIKSYLACGGLSAVTGKPLSIGTSNVDHRLSLDNGGKDEPENWIWMETEMNMNKSSLTDEQLVERAKKALSATDDEIKKKQMKSFIKNESKKFVTEHYKQIFEIGGNGGITEDDLKAMDVKELKGITYGWNKVYPKTSDSYIQTYKSQVGGSRAGAGGKGGRGVAMSKSELMESIKTQLNKKEKILTSEEIEALNGQLQEGINDIKEKAKK